ncbi:MAG: tRNA (N6-threonylcarbamoyladenosine(37)-N6)-methyltransferase TrmO [Kiritimatiellia bacterium]|jgi:tRNA-Thr(GGU) m(6)t(6)A37 methyltransferase TsaA|uniref:tRNA (N6-threonylcarbamoyladenosine(37)-N6)-methyltransferase TrmO n=1 Tax=Atribacter sp. TaxID=2847780 RepID=UPI003D99F85E
MNASNIALKQIGVIHTEHVEPEKTPIQPIFAKTCVGHVEVFPDHVDGLQDLEHFSHIYLIYLLHKAKETRLLTKPFLQDKVRGVFATRAPCRPNPLGLSIVRLCKRDGNLLTFEGADMLDGSPLLDIKPYTKRFDHIQTERDGWHDEVEDAEADRRGVRNYRPQHKHDSLWEAVCRRGRATFGHELARLNASR